MKTLSAVIQEFIDDVDAVGHKAVKEDWPDLYATYCRALEAVGRPAPTNEDEDDEDARTERLRDEDEQPDQDEDWLDDEENADTLADWRYEVANGDTSRSYQDWLGVRREQNADRRAYLAGQTS